MKLAQEQIQHIENYLEAKELRQIDIKLEVLDHMCNGVEESIENENLSFIDAFEKQRIKWHSELNSYSSAWLGMAYSGPKIMIKKAVNFIKSEYLKVLVFSLLFTLMFYFLEYNSINISSYTKELILAVGGYYFFSLGIMVFVLIKMIQTKTNTTYRYLFKRHVFGYGFMYVIFNPILRNDTESIFNLGDKYPEIFFVGALMAFSYTSWKLYKHHKRVVLRQQKLA